MQPPDRERLAEGASALGLSLDDTQLDLLLAYQTLIAKWNRVYNLTAVREPDEMLTHHLLDSLAVVPPLRRHLAERGMTQARLLDVGSGAGLPGMVIGAVLPQVQVVCVDTVGKKASFIRQAAGELGLRHVRAEHARVEELELPEFDVVTARAFAALADFVSLTRRHLAPHGVWMAMKGKRPVAETAALPADVNVFHVEQLVVPGLDAERCLVWMAPTASERTSP